MSQKKIQEKEIQEKENNIRSLSKSEILKLCTPKYNVRHAILTEDVIQDILALVLQGVFIKKNICGYLGLKETILTQWLYRGTKELEKNKTTIRTQLVEGWEKARNIFYLKNKQVLNHALEQKNIAVAIANLGKYFPEEAEYITKVASMEREKAVKTTEVEVLSPSKLKITETMEKSRLMLSEYLDNFNYIEDAQEVYE
jgi:hypothetical protein